MDPVVTRPSGKWVPIVASIPHGGRFVPDWIAKSMLIDLDRSVVDWYTVELYSFLAEIGVPSVAATIDRLVADPNRRPDGPILEPFPKGLIATALAHDVQIYATLPSEAEIAQRIELAHTPYHAALDVILHQALARFDRVLLVDLHSFSTPLDVDVVTGDGRGTTSRVPLTEAIEESLRTEGFSVRRNDPFSGGWIVRRFADHPTVDAVQLELNQRVYCDPTEIHWPDWRRPTFDKDRVAATAARLRRALMTVAESTSRLDLAQDGETVTSHRRPTY